MARVRRLVASDNAALAFAWLAAADPSKERRLIRITLPVGTCVTVPNLICGPADRRAWVTDLLSASVDGTELILVVGCESFPEENGNVHVAYHVAAMSVGDGSFRSLGRLIYPYA
jgi:hypothetical protein